MTPVDVEAIVARYRTAIEKAVPEARTFLSGSSLLGSFSGHDIDLVVLVADIAAATRKLRGLYPPLYEEEEWRDDWAAFRDPGPPQVDIVVTAPGTSGEAHHRRAWDLLLSDDALRAEYLRLKAAGMTSDQKRQFFDRLVRVLEGRR